MPESECCPTPYQLIAVVHKEARDQWCRTTYIQSTKGIDCVHADEPFRVIEESKGQPLCAFRDNSRHAIKGTGTARSITLMG
jgi:hypothetical protein